MAKVSKMYNCSNPAECQLRTRFKAGDETIYVIKSESEEIPLETINTDEKSRQVILGSLEHQDMVQLSINDLKLEINRFELENNQDKRERAEAALQKREKELMFLRENCSQTDSIEGNSTAFESAEQSSTDGSFEESAPVIHVTAATFGQISKLKVIEHSKSHEMFPIPRIRQYIIDGVMHRSNSHMHVQWLELFMDLIYVGTVQKAGHYIEKGAESAIFAMSNLVKLAAGSSDPASVNFNILSWKTFLYFVLIFSPILQRWRTQTYLVNQILHQGVIPKLIVFVLVSFLIIMGSTIDHAFDLSPLTNKSS